MQNKANLLDTQMNVNSILTKDYERNDIFAVPENKANSNPIKPNFKRERYCAYTVVLWSKKPSSFRDLTGC